MESGRENYEYLDVLRCGALYLVVLLHCISGTLADAALVGTPVWWVCNVLNSAARMGVPLFFMLSGALLLSDQRTLDPIPFYRRRMHKILLPFLCWDLIYFLEGAWLQGMALSPARFFSELLTLRGSKYHLWFVYKIVSIYLLLPFLKYILDHCRRRDAWLLLGVVLLQPSVLPLVSLLPGIHLDLFGTLVDGRVGFFLLGWLLFSEPPPPWARRLLYGGGILAFLLNIFGNAALSSPGQVNLWFNDGCALTHFLTAGAVFLAVKDQIRVSRGLAALCRRLSRWSYGIYLSHALFLDAAGLLLGKTRLGTAWTLLVSFLTASAAATAFAALVHGAVVFLKPRGKRIRNQSD